MVKAKAGPGKKECPKCKKLVGVRTQECECGHKFEPKTAKQKSGKVGVEVLRYCALNGGVEAVKKELDSYKENELAKFIAQCGGIDKAKAELEKVK